MNRHPVRRGSAYLVVLVTVLLVLVVGLGSLQAARMEFAMAPLPGHAAAARLGARSALELSMHTLTQGHDWRRTAVHDTWEDLGTLEGVDLQWRLLDEADGVLDSDLCDGVTLLARGRIDGGVRTIKTTLVPNTSLELDELTMDLDPVAYWPLREQGGTLVLERVSGFDGAYTNGAEPNATRRPTCHAAPTLDGFDDRIDLPSIDEKYMNKGSVSFWFRADGLQQATLVQVCADGESVPAFTASIDSTPRLVVSLGEEASIRSLHTAAVQVNRWCHVLVTWDTSGIVLYLDGARAVDNTTRLMPAFDGPITLGDRLDCDSLATDQSRCFQGSISEVAVFRDCLSASDVQALYDAGTECPNLRTGPDGYELLIE